MAGKFITFEGIDGCGKTTQAALLVESIKGWGLDVVATREPGGGGSAETIRQLVLGDLPLTRSAEVYLHFAARAENVECLIEPALRAGTWVVSDRYYDSTAAFNGYPFGQPIGDRIDQMVEWFPVPDLTIVLDVPAAEARARNVATGKSDRYERRDEAYRQKVAEYFSLLPDLRGERCVRVNGNRDPETVQAAILSVVASRLLKPPAKSRRTRRVAA